MTSNTHTHEESKPLAGRLALITGASGGIGKATSLALASKGCAIAVHFNSRAAEADALVAQLKAEYGVKAIAFQADLSSFEAARQLHKAVTSQFGDPDILFNNAGVTIKVIGRAGGLDEIDAELFEKTWRINCATAFELTRLCIPYMEHQKWGRVVFCSSVAALTGGVVGPHYASSKSALHGFMHWLSQRYSSCGITSNAVAPALITETAMLPGNPEELRQMIPVKRLGLPKEVASVVEMLVLNGYMTNKVIPIDGGMLAY